MQGFKIELDAIDDLDDCYPLPGYHGTSWVGTSIPGDQDLLLCVLLSSQQHAKACTHCAGKDTHLR